MTGHPALPSVLFRCDASPSAGAGHVMRCLALADFLSSQGATVMFACSTETPDTVAALRNSGYPLIVLHSPCDPAELLESGQRWDVAVIDHYGLGSYYEGRLRLAAPIIAAIDDLADRSHDCDILLDQTAGRRAADYANLVPPETQKCLGPQFALLRTEFAQARQAALSARARQAPVRQVFISFGMTDVGEVTAQAVKSTLETGLDVQIAVAVGSHIPNLAALQELAACNDRVSLHLDSSDVCGLMAASDLAIGAAGTTSWERCCLGLPTVLMVLAENQSLIAQNLAKLGAVLIAEKSDEIGPLLRGLAVDRNALATMSASAAAVCDGQGTQRLSELIFEKIVQTANRTNLDSSVDVYWNLSPRRADRGDAWEMWLQRNDVKSRSNSRDQAFVPYSRHLEWLESSLKDPDRQIWIVDGMKPCGQIKRGLSVVRFDRCGKDGKAWLTSISMAVAFRGKGLSGRSLKIVCEQFLEDNPGTILYAEIAPANAASRRIFESLGFFRCKFQRTQGFDLYRLERDLLHSLKRIHPDEQG